VQRTEGKCGLPDAPALLAANAKEEAALEAEPAIGTAEGDWEAMLL